MRSICLSIIIDRFNDARCLRSAAPFWWSICLYWIGCEGAGGGGGGGAVPGGGRGIRRTPAAAATPTPCTGSPSWTTGSGRVRSLDEWSPPCLEGGWRTDHNYVYWNITNISLTVLYVKIVINQSKVLQKKLMRIESKNPQDSSYEIIKISSSPLNYLYCYVK